MKVASLFRLSTPSPFDSIHSLLLLLLLLLLMNLILNTHHANLNTFLNLFLLSLSIHRHCKLLLVSFKKEATSGPNEAFISFPAKVREGITLSLSLSLSLFLSLIVSQANPARRSPLFDTPVVVVVSLQFL